LRIPQRCPECDGEIYEFTLNGQQGFKCKRCDFMDVEEFEEFSSPEMEVKLTKELERLTGKVGWYKI